MLNLLFSDYDEEKDTQLVLYRWTAFYTGIPRNNFVILGNFEIWFSIATLLGISCKS